MPSAPQPKPTRPRRTGAYVAAFFLAVAVGGMGVAIWREIQRSIVVEDRVREVRRDAEKLAANREALARMLTALRDPATLEREAKVQLNLRRPDEQVVVVVPDGGDTVTRNIDISKYPQPAAADMSALAPAASAPAPAEPRGVLTNAQSWWEYFFGPHWPR